MHSIPNATEKELSQASSILGLRLFLGQTNQLLLNLSRASSTLLQMIENIAIRVGQAESSYRSGEIPSKSSTTVTVTALVPGIIKTDVLDFTSSTGSVFFGEVACLHLLHQQEEIVGDEIFIFVQN